MTVRANDRDDEKVCDIDDCYGWKAGESRYCHHHKGLEQGPKSDDVGAPEGNTNAVAHGLYAEENRFYQDVMTGSQRALCDEIFQDYCTRFRERNGEPHTGEQARMFEIAVNHIKLLHSDNWLAHKPESLDSGNPMVDRFERYNSEGVPYEEYRETVVLDGQKKLKQEDRQWLKDYNLLHSAEQKDAEGTQALAEIWAKELQ